jgi:putative ABC transport system ATP-binding protein
VSPADDAERCGRDDGGMNSTKGIPMNAAAAATAALSDERVLLDHTPPAVAAREIARRYGEGDTAVDALRGVSLEVPRGELTAVMGPSGSGKSTLMHILAGLDRPTSGSVEIDGTEITTLNDNELTKLRRKHIGFVFQFFNLLPMLTAEENVTLPLTLAGRKPEPGWLDELLESVGLEDRRKHRPAELSGGQQQRVAIARALISRPTVLFADEPTGNLDSASSGEILELVRRSVDELGQTTVMVTHDPVAATIADRVLLLGDGAIARTLARPTQTQVIDAIQEVAGR